MLSRFRKVRVVVMTVMVILLPLVGVGCPPLPEVVVVPIDPIEWEKPIPMVERITGQGPVEVIPSELLPGLEAWGVDLEGRRAMLTGYQLPEGWREAVEGVDRLVIKNSGSLPHDPATALNAEIFEKMTGIHIDFIEMRDELLWPKTLSVAVAGADHVDLFYLDRGMMETAVLSAAGWIHPVCVLYPLEVQALFPEGVLMSMMGLDDRFYGAPLTLWSEYLFYRPSWLREAGVEVPETWQDLVVASRKVAEWAEANLGPGYAGMVKAVGDPDSIYRIWAALTYARDKTVIRDERVIVDPGVWKLLTDLWLEGGVGVESIGYMWADAPEVFAKGRAGFIITGSVFMRRFGCPEYAGMIQDDWGVTPAPAWEGVGVAGRGLGEPDVWVINSAISPERKPAAMLWLDFARSFQAQFNEIFIEGNESSMKAVYDHPVIKAEVDFPDVRAAAVAQQRGERFPAAMPEIVELFKESLHAVVMGEDPTLTLTWMQAEIDRMR